MISRIQDCILVSLDDAMDPSSEEELNKSLSRLADHGMIFNSSDSRTYHSSQGSYQSGVRSHDVKKTASDDDSFGSLVVFNIKDSKVKEYLMEVVMRWDPTRDPALYAKIKEEQKENKVLILPTPFTNFHSRTADEGSPEHISRLELYRAFRAHERNRLNIPLSKEKGVSCGNFVSYAMKVAVIKRLFPDGLPTEIADKLNEIENKKTKDNRKLSSIDPAYFEDFERIVLKHLDNQKKLGLEIDPFLQELRRLVKHKSINRFCKDAFKNPDLYDFGGYVFVREINSKSELWVMPHALYIKFMETYPGKSSSITDEQLNSLGVETKAETTAKPLASLARFFSVQDSSSETKSRHERRKAAHQFLDNMDKLVSYIQAKCDAGETPPQEVVTFVIETTKQLSEVNREFSSQKSNSKTDSQVQKPILAPGKR